VYISPNCDNTLIMPTFIGHVYWLARRLIRVALAVRGMFLILVAQFGEKLTTGEGK